CRRRTNSRWSSTPSSTRFEPANLTITSHRPANNGLHSRKRRPDRHSDGVGPRSTRFWASGTSLMVLKGLLRPCGVRTCQSAVKMGFAVFLVEARLILRRLVWLEAVRFSRGVKFDELEGGDLPFPLSFGPGQGDGRLNRRFIVTAAAAVVFFDPVAPPADAR